MLETYQAWGGTYDDSAIVTREVIQEVADEAIGTRQVSLPDGTIYDFDGEWPSLQMYPSLSDALGGEEITPDTSLEYLLGIAGRLGLEIPHDRGYGHGKLIEELWEHTVGSTLWAPGIRQGFPGRDHTVDPAAPQHPWRDRKKVGSVRARVRVGYRLLRARRSDRAARTLRGPSQGGGCR